MVLLEINSENRYEQCPHCALYKLRLARKKSESDDNKFECLNCNIHYTGSL